MGASRSWSWGPRLLVALALCLTVAGCTGGGQDAASDGDAAARVDAEGRSADAPGAPDPDPGQQPGGAPGAPGAAGGSGEQGGGGAVTAPITIPDITIAQGRPVDEVKQEIESRIRSQCDDKLCVTLTVEPRDPNFTTCQFVTTDPAPGTKVEPKRTVVVVIVTGTEPCTPDPGTDGGGDGGQPPEDGSVTENSQPPTDSSVPEDAQPPSTS
jgi:hypothetical protein